MIFYYIKCCLYYDIVKAGVNAYRSIKANNIGNQLCLVLFFMLATLLSRAQLKYYASQLNLI